MEPENIIRGVWKKSAKLRSILPLDRLAVGIQPRTDLPRGLIVRSNTQGKLLTNLGFRLDFIELELSVYSKKRSSLMNFDKTLRDLLFREGNFGLLQCAIQPVSDDEWKYELGLAFYANFYDTDKETEAPE
ncbi:MAG: hypothetical protein Q4D38_08040 [Planctomycetia bacterium]|nr:hypothetical protein [Planctomycetia bacterium]